MADLKATLKALARDSWEESEKPSDWSFGWNRLFKKEDLRTTSKHGGLPYMEEGETWPVCACSQHQNFICQFDVRGAPLPEEFDFEFFTFFYCLDCFGTGEGSYTARVYNKISQPAKLELLEKFKIVGERKYSFREKKRVPNHVAIQDYVALEVHRELKCLEKPYQEVVSGMGMTEQMCTHIGG